MPSCSCGTYYTFIETLHLILAQTSHPWQPSSTMEASWLDICSPSTLPIVNHLARTSICNSDKDRYFFLDPSSSISDRSQIDQTGTTTTLLCLAVIMYSHRWRNLIYSRSWDYKASFHNYNTNNGLILARHVGWGMHSSYFIRILVKQWLAISGTMTDQIVMKV